MAQSVTEFWLLKQIASLHHVSQFELVRFLSKPVIFVWKTKDQNNMALFVAPPGHVAPPSVRATSAGSASRHHAPRPLQLAWTWSVCPCRNYHIKSYKPFHTDHHGCIAIKSCLLPYSCFLRSVSATNTHDKVGERKSRSRPFCFLCWNYLCESDTCLEYFEPPNSPLGMKGIVSRGYSSEFVAWVFVAYWVEAPPGARVWQLFRDGKSLAGSLFFFHIYTIDYNSIVEILFHMNPLQFNHFGMSSQWHRQERGAAEGTSWKASRHSERTAYTTPKWWISGWW